MHPNIRELRTRGLSPQMIANTCGLSVGYVRQLIINANRIGVDNDIPHLCVNSMVAKSDLGLSTETEDYSARETAG